MSPALKIYLHTRACPCQCSACTICAIWPTLVSVCEQCVCVPAHDHMCVGCAHMHVYKHSAVDVFKCVVCAYPAHITPALTGMCAVLRVPYGCVMGGCRYPARFPRWPEEPAESVCRCPFSGHLLSSNTPQGLWGLSLFLESVVPLALATEFRKQGGWFPQPPGRQPKSRSPGL